MQPRRLAGFILLRNFVSAILVGLLTGWLTSSVWPPKKGKSTDVIWGIIGAVLGSLFLAILRGGVRLIPTLTVQIIGALIIILLGRLLTSEKK